MTVFDTIGSGHACIEDFPSPSIKKRAAQPPNQPRKSTKHDKTSDNQMGLACSCMFLPSLTPFHAGSFGNSFARHEKKMEETGKNERRGTLPGRSQVECHSIGILQKTPAATTQPAQKFDKT